MTTYGTPGDDTINGTSGTDYIDAGAGNDHLYGGKGTDYLYGGLGNDTFKVKLSDLQAGAYTTIYDFGGAGGWNAGNNDFLALVGFSAGSTLSVQKDSTVNPGLTYYTIHDQATNADFTIAIKSLNGTHVSTGDYNFY
jgi:Ca2+-binding RTX toxin-like protein